MRVLVCGGRTWGEMPRGLKYGTLEYWQAKTKVQVERSFVTDQLDNLHLGTEGPITVIIHGAARGADQCAGTWARKRLVCEIAVPANWSGHGMAAGPIRNQRMLLDEPDLVLAFPGGKGTAHMVKIAREAGIRVLELKPE